MSSCLTPDILIQAIVAKQSLSDKCYFVLNSGVQPTPFQLGSYVKAFSLTCLLESPFYFWAAWHFRPSQKLKILVIANLATHPMIYFLFPILFSRLAMKEVNYLTVAETFAPLVEGLLVWKVWKVPAKMAFPLMILANLFSWAVGSYLAG